MQTDAIEKRARKLHRQWMDANQDYISSCRNSPRIYSQSHDFDRAVNWNQLPEHWKKQYRREAKYRLLIE